MACSKYQYVKQYQQHRTALKKCFILVRIDGRSFTNFCQAHHFQKPNDLRAIKLMNSAAMFVCRKFKDIFLAYGQSDQYSFVLGRNSQLFNRRIDKIQTCIVSAFTSAYVHKWKSFFEKTLQQPLHNQLNKFQYEQQQLPTFDARIVVYPDLQTIKDYFKWRQVDCHINNLYNTVFWCMMKSQKYDKLSQNNQRQEHQQKERDERIQEQQEDQEKANIIQIQCKRNKKRKKQMQKNTYIESILKDTNSGQKNQILFSEFGINYNNIQAIYRRGTVLCYRKASQLENNNKQESKSMEGKNKNLPKVSKQLKSSIRQLRDVAQNTQKTLNKLSIFKQLQQKVSQDIFNQQHQIYKQLQSIRKQVEGMKGKYQQIDRRISNIKNKNKQVNKSKDMSHHNQRQKKEFKQKDSRDDNQQLQQKSQKKQKQQTEQKTNLNSSNKNSGIIKNKIRNNQQYIMIQCHQDLIRQQFWETIKID